jgi:2-dehydropantoate 2-reductase
MGGLRIAVVGAGAMGSIYAGLLADSGLETWLIGRTPRHPEAIESRGLLLTHVGDRRSTHPRATTDAGDAGDAGEVDVVMIWTKSQHTDAAIEAARPLVGPRTLVASFQNGLGNVEKIAAAFDRDAVVYGVSTVGGVTGEPGEVELTEATWNGEATTWMGVLEGDPEVRLGPLAAAFAAAGMRAEVRADIDVVVWSKLAMALPMNSTAALTRLDMGAVVDNPGLAGLVRAMIAEVVAVANARGIPLDPDQAQAQAADTYAAARAHLPSMLQDVLAGRPTEVDAIVGGLVREGERLGVETPVAATVWPLAAALDRPPSPARPS